MPRNTKEPLRGRALAEATLQHIKDNPQEWDQTHWHCGTRYCFAGHAALLAGWKLERPELQRCAIVYRHGPLCHVMNAAMEDLQLSDSQANQLFYSGNSIKDLENHIDRIYCPNS